MSQRLGFKHLVETLRAIDYCPVYLQWSPWTAADPGRRLRRWASRHQLPSRAPWRRWALFLVVTGTWPLRALLLIRQNARTLAPEVAIRRGKPVWRQCLEQIWLALWHSLPPPAYYHYELYHPKRRPQASQYLHQYEASSLLPYLNRYYHHPAIEDKREFARLCAMHGVPTVLLLGIFDNGNFSRPPGIPSADRTTDDIFVKPARGGKGAGTMVWHWLEPGWYQDQQGTVLSWENLVEHLKKLSSRHALVAQPRLHNHPDIAILSTGALCTARIVTGRTPAGDIELVAATLKMPWKKEITDTHGLSAPIEPETGTLGRAYSYRPTCPEFDTHPETGACISGQMLPHWAETLAIARQAHKLVPGYAFLGWDVAPTSGGPLLLEGNAGWDVLTVQKPQRGPLAQTCFARLASLWMKEPRFMPETAE